VAEAALTGTRVLDLSESVAGQYCTRLMADYGASVVLVEPPSGSRVRALGPFKDHGYGDTDSLLFWHLNTGKGSVTLDWQQPSGAAILEELAESADVALVDRSVDRAALRAANPRLVTCLVSDFGEDGPYAGWQGSEMIHQALAGTMLVTGKHDSAPLYGFGHRTSYACGLTAYITSLAALHAREATGEGQDVEASIMESAAAMGQVFASQFFYNGTYFERGKYPNVVSLVRCRDGWVVPFGGIRWGALCKAFNAEELIDDERFAKLPSRQRNWSEVMEVFRHKAADLSADEIVDVGQKGKASVSKIMTVRDLWESPHLRERDFWEEVETESGRRAALGPAFRMSRTPRSPSRAAPEIGRDTPEVLGAIGLAGDERDHLRDAGVI
jgi:crotonobetainyl-CoA:carnitine CoA-transferase CaiB-like acyl-CoA transferase